jgi:hypothetical protein
MAGLFALFENVQLFQPSHKGVCCSMGLFFALRALHPVQNFIALVDSRSSLLLASKARRVVEVADDAPILEMQLRCEIKLSRHAAETPGCTRSSAERLRPRIVRPSLRGDQLIDKGTIITGE